MTEMLAAQIYLVNIFSNSNREYHASSNTNDIGSYRQTSNTRRTLVGNKIVDHSDVVGALPVGAAPTTSSFST